MHPGQKLKPGARVVFEGIHTLHGEILERRFFGRRLVRLWTEDGTPVDAAVDAIGHVPLPPYIKRDDRADDRDRYQTVFAAGARLDRRADRRPALHPVADRGPGGARRRDRRDYAPRRLRHLSAGARRSRRGSSPRAGALRHRRARRPPPITRARDGRIAASSPSARRRRGRSRRWRSRTTASIVAGTRRDRSVHLSRLRRSASSTAC